MMNVIYKCVDVVSESLKSCNLREILTARKESAHSGIEKRGLELVLKLTG